MVKNQAKTLKTKKNLSNTLLEYKLTLKKSRQQIYQENYQKNKEKKKAQQKERYNRKKEQAENQAQEQFSKYSQASDYRVLMSLKKYTELNSAKRKIWLNFMWTLNDFKKMGTPNNIIEIMKLREVAENLINDYWHTAKNELKKGKSWNSLSEEQKSKLIKYWGQEKVRKEKQLTEALEQQEIEGKNYEKEIELAKFHEERGKIKCVCWNCAEKKKIRDEVKQELFKESESDKEQCSECITLLKLNVRFKE